MKALSALTEFIGALIADLLIWLIVVVGVAGITVWAWVVASAQLGWRAYSRLTQLFTALRGA